MVVWWRLTSMVRMSSAFSATLRGALCATHPALLLRKSSSTTHVRTPDSWVSMRRMPMWTCLLPSYVCVSTAAQDSWQSPTSAMVRRLLRRLRVLTFRRIAPRWRFVMPWESSSMVEGYRTDASLIVVNASRSSIPTVGPMVVWLRQHRSIGRRGAMRPCLTRLLPVFMTSVARTRTRWRSVMTCLISTSSWWSTRPLSLCFATIINWLVIPSYCLSLLSMRATSMPTIVTIGRRPPRKAREYASKTERDM